MESDDNNNNKATSNTNANSNNIKKKRNHSKKSMKKKKKSTKKDFTTNNNNNLEPEKTNTEEGLFKRKKTKKELNREKKIKQECAIKLMEFWKIIGTEISDSEFQPPQLSLSKIKKLVKTDEDVKLISSELPIIFGKACEIFISELALRAWVYTSNNERIVISSDDIAEAIAETPEYDFLSDLIPREDFSKLQSRKVIVLNSFFKYYIC